MNATTAFTRREWFIGSGALGLALGLGGWATTHAAPARAVPMTVYKDANCGCCSAWAEQMRAAGAFAPTIIDETDMAAVKARLRVPTALASCHTVEVGGYVVEGHVPAADIARLLRERPQTILGLAVPGMPAGSPGMEMPDGRREPFQVIAFTADGRQSVFASHA